MPDKKAKEWNEFENVPRKVERKKIEISEDVLEGVVGGSDKKNELDREEMEQASGG